MTSNLKVEKLSQELIILEKNKKFEDAEIVAKTLVGFFSDAELNIRPFRSNKLWERTKNRFHPKPWHWEDLPCTLEIVGSSVPIDFKLFWTKKTSKQIVAGITNFSSNYEDSPIYEDYNLWIDIVVPNTTDRVIIVLTNKYVLRTLELHGKLTATQQEILHKWIQEFDFSNKKLLHETLWQGFNIKSLNKKFYESIVTTFTALVQHLEHSGLDSHESRQFTNRLIGRVVFCRFLRKKNIISEQFDYFTIQEKNSTEYYNQILSTLFFSTLNLPIEERKQIIRNLWIDKETPYLNWWLFERKWYDNNDNITFPIRFFHDFFDFLSEYNFTTDESTSTYQQVAVDPEMLGRIFENLLAEQNTETGEQARKAKWAFYTPREIVDYMCKEAVKTHLIQRLNTQEVPQVDIEKILEQLFTKSDSEYALYSKNAWYDIIQSKHRGKIIDALDNVTVIDPACGSGAFPMGMMQTILQCYERVLPETKFDPAEAKKNIIENCLFGVDIEPMAVEISRLRAWLSIIVDEMNESKVEPLPNLDFKFVCANSLVRPNHNEWWLWDKPNLKDNLEKLRHKYYRARTIKSKKEIKDEYISLLNTGNLFESKYSEMLKSFNAFDASKAALFFDPEYMFWESWFDIVISNPPRDKVKAQDPKFLSSIYPEYRQLSKENQKSIKQKLLGDPKISLKYNEYIKECWDFARYVNSDYKLQGSSDLNLFKIFTELAINISNTTVSFLIPWSLTVDEWSTSMRKYLLDNKYIKTLIWYTNKKWLFDGIDNNQKFITLILQKQPTDSINVLWWIDNTDDLSRPYINLSPNFYKNFDIYSTLYIDDNPIKYEIYTKILNSPMTKALKDIDFHFRSEYHSTNDAHYFSDKEWKYKLFAGKCINIYDAMQKSWLSKHWRSALFETLWYPKDGSYRTEYFVSEVPNRIIEHHKADKSNYRIVVQDITWTVNNRRTVYSAILHKNNLTNNTLNNVYLWKSDPELVYYLALLSSFVLDFQARMKVATHVNKFILETFLVPVYEKVDEKVREEIINNTLRLIAVSEDYNELVQSLLWVKSYQDVLITDEKERQKIKNINDALMANIYWLTYEEFSLVLSTFPLIDSKIKEDILLRFKELI